MSRGLGKTQQKILLLLQAGIGLGLSGSPRRYFQILKLAKQEWDWINTGHLKRSVSSLYKEKLVKEKNNKDGTVSLVLSDEGKEKVITLSIDNLKIKKPKRWDGSWRIVMYDVPENYKAGRDSMRMHLKNIGFLELQKSVFVYPYDCYEQIEFLIEHHGIGKHVRLVVADFIDNEDYLIRKFKLKE